jgi:hypothetical protein
MSHFFGKTIFTFIVLLCVSACQTKTSTSNQYNFFKRSPLSINLSLSEKTYTMSKKSKGYFIIEIKNKTDYAIQNFSFINNITFYAACEESLAPLELNIYNDLMLSLSREVKAQGYYQITLNYEDIFKKKIERSRNDPMNTMWYWSWSLSQPEPPTPLHIDANNICEEVFFWFVVNVNQSEFISNKVLLEIIK